MWTTCASLYNPMKRPKRIAVAIELKWNLSWHQDTFQGIVDYGRKHDWRCVLDPYLDDMSGNAELDQYDGIIGRLANDTADRAAASCLPAINLIHESADIPIVKIDAKACAQLAYDHLVANGYHRLGYITSAPTSIRLIRMLEEVFGKTAESHGMPPPVSLAINDGDFSNPALRPIARRKITEWIQIQGKPIGLLIYQSSVARYLIQICDQLNIKVPEQVGIVAHDADPQTANSISPTLTTIELDCWEWGYKAAERLDKLMQGKCSQPRVQTIAPKRLIVGESSDAFVFQDKLVSQAMHHISENSRQTLSADQVAAEFGVSRRTLDRRFAEALGRTVAQEIVRLRIQQIERLVTESELPMSKIANLYGFGSGSHFTQYFRQHTGLTPTLFRKHYQGKR